MKDRNCLILTQYRDDSQYNDFIGKFYHFPATEKKNYLKQFENLPLEIIYYEPDKKGTGEFYGYGKISKPPFSDKRESGHYFVEISDYKSFAKPVHFKNDKGEVLEKLHNTEFYNYNNAVRKIIPKFLDELCLDGGILLNFTADAHLVQVLGEQLIASERVGILELVKNSFDAGASNCLVRIEKIPKSQDIPEIPNSIYKFDEYAGPVIIIEDNGSGMTKEEIELGWLRPASTLKTSVKEYLKKEKAKAEKEGKLKAFERIYEQVKKANKGRIPLGEKGVGRFACNRLGSKLIIKTKVVENDYEYVLEIDWDDFTMLDGSHKDLSDVKVSLTRQSPTRDYGKTNSGTQLIIYGGRDGFELDVNEIRGINRTILKLNSSNPNPSFETPQFHASFECPQVKDLDNVVVPTLYDPVFSIYGIVDENGKLEYDYFFNPPSNIPLARFEQFNKKLDLWSKVKKERKPTCGPFYIHIDVWYRDTPWIGKTQADKKFKDFLEDYGGISIYRDSINVHSAEILGAQTDWLELSQRHSKQTFRIANYHMIGNIELDQSSNVDIIDKTNREGMLKNKAFGDLTELTKSLVYFIELDYMGKRDEYNVLSGDLTKDPRSFRQFSKQSAKIISNINTNYDVALDQYKLFENIEELGDISERKGRLVQLSSSLKNLEKNLKQIEEIQDLLTEQAGFGLGIAVALHEITKTTSNFYYGILDVIERGQFDEKKLEELKDTSKALESEILRLSPLRALRNEEPIKFKVSRSVSYVHSVFKRRFKALEIDFDYNKDEDFEIIARYGALNQILTNMLDNSSYWLDNRDFTNRKVQIKIDSQERTIVVADSGPGFHESILPYLFQPGASLKFPPSGLGLYVCKHYMNLMKKRGDIYLARERDKIIELNGAQLILDFSKVITE